MDDALVQKGLELVEVTQGVLILVLMDDALVLLYPNRQRTP